MPGQRRFPYGPLEREHVPAAPFEPRIDRVHARVAFFAWRVIALPGFVTWGHAPVAVKQGCASNASFRGKRFVFKWLVVIVLMVIITGVLRPGTVRALRLGHLPGDLHFRVFGRAFHLPFASTLLLSLIAWAILRAI